MNLRPGCVVVSICSVPVWSSLDPESKSVGRLEPNSSVFLLNPGALWTKVLLPNGRAGYVMVSVLRKVEQLP